MITGIVVKNMNGYFYVQDDASTVHECKVRGRLKKGRYSLRVGDRVTVHVNDTYSYHVVILSFEKGQDDTSLAISSF